MRNYWTTKSRMVTDCWDCGKHWEGKSTLGIAARHHDKTGHTISTEITYSVVYETKEREAKRFADKKK